jgi:hypothetical protein
MRGASTSWSEAGPSRIENGIEELDCGSIPQVLHRAGSEGLSGTWRFFVGS